MCDLDPVLEMCLLNVQKVAKETRGETLGQAVGEGFPEEAAVKLKMK